jgi:hypothetical protein
MSAPAVAVVVCVHAFTAAVPKAKSTIAVIPQINGDR